jgi:hypothetical protein
MKVDSPVLVPAKVPLAPVVGAGKPLCSLETWWPGTELNRRRQPFQAAYRVGQVVGNQRMSLSVMSLCE